MEITGSGKRAKWLGSKTISIGEKLWVILRFFLLFGLSFLILQPFFIKIIMAFMSPDDLIDATVNLIPRRGATFYWQEALKGMKLSQTLLNSVLLAAAAVLLQLASSALVGYGLARFRFRGRAFLYGMLIIIMLVPNSTYTVAQYLQFKHPLGLNLNLLGTPIPLLILSAGGLALKQGLYIYLFATFFGALPKNLEDAALVDGAGSFRTFWSVILPNSRSVIITVLIFSFSWQWTDIAHARLYLNNFKVIPAMISDIYIRVGLVPDTIGSSIAQNAACILLLIPVLIIFLFGQKYLTQSISRTGMAN